MSEDIEIKTARYHRDPGFRLLIDLWAEQAIRAIEIADLKFEADPQGRTRDQMRRRSLVNVFASPLAGALEDLKR